MSETGIVQNLDLHGQEKGFLHNLLLLSPHFSDQFSGRCEMQYVLSFILTYFFKVKNIWFHVTLQYFMLQYSLYFRWKQCVNIFSVTNKADFLMFLLY